MMPDDGAVVVGGGISGLEAVRALGSAGIRVAVVVTGPTDIAQHSVCASEWRGLPPGRSFAERVLDLLESRAGHWQGRVLIPIGDEVLAVLSEHRERLGTWYRVAAPAPEVARHVLAKDLMYQAAREVGIDLPGDYGPADVGGAAGPGMPFPVIVKPIAGRPFVARFGVKLFVARNRDELRRAVRAVNEAKLRARIQELIPGPDRHLVSYCVYMDARGDPVGELGLRKLRQSPPFYGVSRVVEVADLPHLREPTLELLRHIGWRGVAKVEYKLDPRDGRYRLMEVNGRQFLMGPLARRAGVDYTTMGWRDATLGDPGSAVPNGWAGVLVNLLDELYYGLAFRRLEGLTVGDYLRPYRRPIIDLVLSRGDPKPFAVHFTHMARRLVRAALDRRVRTGLFSRIQPMPAPNAAADR